MNSSGELRIAKADGRTTRRRRKKFFGGFFRSTKWHVGDDGCAIFLFVKKTRHSIQCPFSYLLRKLTTSEWSSFSYLQNPPVTHLISDQMSTCPTILQSMLYEDIAVYDPDRDPLGLLSDSCRGYPFILRKCNY